MAMMMEENFSARRVCVRTYPLIILVHYKAITIFFKEAFPLPWQLLLLLSLSGNFGVGFGFKCKNNKFVMIKARGFCLLCVDVRAGRKEQQWWGKGQAVHNMKYNDVLKVIVAAIIIRIMRVMFSQSFFLLA